MISATSAVFLFYSVMLGVRVLISCDYTFNHNPCDELYGFHGLFTSCDPNFSFKLLFNLLRNRGIHPLWEDDLSRIDIVIFMTKCKNFTDCSLVTTPIPWIQQYLRVEKEPGRSFLRNLRGIGAVSFFYRLS